MTPSTPVGGELSPKSQTRQLIFLPFFSELVIHHKTDTPPFCKAETYRLLFVGVGDIQYEIRSAARRNFRLAGEGCLDVQIIARTFKLSMLRPQNGPITPNFRQNTGPER